jgi:large subunit ribosomal protein L25
MLNVVSRDLNEKTRFIRERGYIPAVIFGNQLDRSIPISVYKTDFARMVDAGENTGVLELNLNGDIRKCLLREVQVDGVKDGFLHIDFMLVD